VLEGGVRQSMAKGKGDGNVERLVVSVSNLCDTFLLARIRSPQNRPAWIHT
jgi:hypothetical protein